MTFSSKRLSFLKQLFAQVIFHVRCSLYITKQIVCRRNFLVSETEQTRIAQMSSDMDEYMQQLENTKRLKQGMMQTC